MTAWADEQAALAARLPQLLETPLVEGLAVRATFDPARVVPPAERPAVEIVSDEVLVRRGTTERMLKDRVRTDVLARMLRRGGPEELRRVRRAQADVSPGALQSVLDRFVEGRQLETAQRSEEELMGALHVIRWAQGASSLASRFDALPPDFVRDDVEARLALMETLRPIREITRDGCVGREEELAQLHRYVSQAQAGLPLPARPSLLVHGLGGVGKSTLVAQFVLDLAQGPYPPAWAYLDLDRPSLSSFEPLSLLRDIARQIGSQFPQARRWLSNESLLSKESSFGEGIESRGHEAWTTLAGQVAQAVTAVLDGRLVVVLDTYEELQRHSARDSSVSEELLYRMFSQLSQNVRHFSLVVSGRVPAGTFVASGTGQIPQEVLVVGPLRPPAAAVALQLLYEREYRRTVEAAEEELPDAAAPAASAPVPLLDADLVREVLGMVGTSPLTLKLAARVLAREGGAAVREVADEAQRAGALERVREGFVDGFLYRRVLNHLRGIGTIPSSTLQQVARACIPLRRITPEVLRDIVLPEARVGRVDVADAMAGLAAEAAFADDEGNGLRLRPELRGPALLALRFSAPELVVAVHRRAAGYYAGRPDDAAAVERTYHLLAAGLPVEAGAITAGSLDALAGVVDDLPPAGRELVTRVLHDPLSLDAELARRAREREVEASVTQALTRGDVDGARNLLADRTWWAAGTTLYASLSLVEEQRGDLAAAAEAARADLTAAEAAHDHFRFVAAAVRIALLEERLTGDGAAGAAVLADTDRRPWLGDAPLLHLELRLNRLALLERHRLPYDRWLDRLDTRALLRRCDPAALRDRTAIMRLLAAVFGDEEPRLVVDAVRIVGVGTTTPAPLVVALARALAAWDVEPEPGAVARRLRLWVPDPFDERSMADVWASAVVSTQSDAVATLGEAFAVRAPDDAVIDALRVIYLWWGVDPQLIAASEAEAQAAAPDSAEHFLDGGLDFASDDLQRLVRTLRGAYPKAQDTQQLASRSGLDLTNLNWRETPGRLVRDVLAEADRADRLGPLLGEALADPKSASFHEEIREIVGTEWLDREGIV